MKLQSNFRWNIVTHTELQLGNMIYQHLQKLIANLCYKRYWTRHETCLLDPSVMTCKGRHGTFGFPWSLDICYWFHFQTIVISVFLSKNTRKTLEVEVVQYNQQSTQNQWQQ